MGLWSARAALCPLRCGKGLCAWGLPLLEGFHEALQTQVVVPRLCEAFMLRVESNQVDVIALDDVPAPLFDTEVIVAVVERCGSRTGRDALHLQGQARSTSPGRA